MSTPGINSITRPLSEQSLSFESDFQAFCKLKEQLDGLLIKSDMDDLWQKVRVEYSNSSPTEKYAIALALAEDHILNCSTMPAEPSLQPPIAVSGKMEELCHGINSSSSQFAQFAQVFADFLDSSILRSIWNELDTHIPDEEKLEIASVFALDRLKEPDHFSTKKFTAKSTKQRNKKHSKLTPQQECVAFIASIFETERINELTIQLALQDRRYNIEDTIEHFCLLILKNGCFLRPNVTFADVVLNNADLLEPPSYSSSKRSGVEGIEAKKSIMDKVRCPQLLNAATEYEINMRVLEHIFKPKNPHIKCSLSSRGEIVYEGTKEFFSRDVYLLSIRLDLHGLTVYHSLSILESCLSYYCTAESEGRLWGRAGNIKIVLVLIVGKGLHSEGQRARIGPAIVKYLQEWQIKDYVYYEGEITVQIKL